MVSTLNNQFFHSCFAFLFLRSDISIFARKEVLQLVTYGPVHLQREKIIYSTVILNLKKLRKKINYDIGESFCPCLLLVFRHYEILLLISSSLKNYICCLFYSCRYHSALRKAVEQDIVVGVSNLYDYFFVPTGKRESKVTAARLPYFDGDFWSGAAMDKASEIEQHTGGNREKIMKLIPSRSLKWMGCVNLSKGTAKDILVMQKVGFFCYISSS